MPIISSILNTDLYKLTMAQAVLHQFPETRVKFKFKCRNEGINFSPIKTKIEQEIQNLKNIRLTNEEFEYLNSIRFFKKDFLYFLKDFRLKPDEFITINEDNGNLNITIEGPWVQTILFETFILSIVNEHHFAVLSHNSGDIDYLEIRSNRLLDKLKMLVEAPEGFMVTEFGTRRRFSAEWQEIVIQELIKTGRLAGTSNVYLAMKYGITPIGTMSHEWLQTGQATHVRLVESQKYMLDVWAREYRGDLGIALTDVIGMDAFLRDFDMFFAKLYDGCRHDSGDPIEWGEKLIAHYESMNINPKTKTAIWSDGLTIPKAISIYMNFHERIKCGFGIGTNLTNDVGFDPLNIVIKMIECNGQPVAKLSDSPGKTMCEDKEYVKYLKKVFNKND